MNQTIATQSATNNQTDNGNILGLLQIFNRYCKTDTPYERDDMYRFKDTAISHLVAQGKLHPRCVITRPTPTIAALEDEINSKHPFADYSVDLELCDVDEHDFYDPNITTLVALVDDDYEIVHSVPLTADELAEAQEHNRQLDLTLASLADANSNDNVFLASWSAWFRGNRELSIAIAQDLMATGIGSAKRTKAAIQSLRNRKDEISFAGGQRLGKKAAWYHITKRAVELNETEPNGCPSAPIVGKLWQRRNRATLEATRKSLKPRAVSEYIESEKIYALSNDELAQQYPDIAAVRARIVNEFSHLYPADATIETLADDWLTIERVLYDELEDKLRVDLASELKAGLKKGADEVYRILDNYDEIYLSSDLLTERPIDLRYYYDYWGNRSLTRYCRWHETNLAYDGHWLIEYVAVNADGTDNDSITFHRPYSDASAKLRSLPKEYDAEKQSGSFGRVPNAQERAHFPLVTVMTQIATALNITAPITEDEHYERYYR